MEKIGRRRNKSCTRAIQARKIEIKNQSVKNALESDVANQLPLRKLIWLRKKMSKGVSNFQIENVLDI